MTYPPGKKEKEVSHDDDDVQGILDELVTTKAISLPKLKRSIEVNKIMILSTAHIIEPLAIL